MNNDIDPDKKQQELEERLVQENYGLVVSQALSFLDNNSKIDDYIQAGLIGLLKAIRKYDSNKAKFSTFTSVCIRNEILNLKRKEKSNRKVKVFYNSDLVESANKHFIKKESFAEFEPEYLTEEQKFILRMKLANHTNAEIAEHLSCSRKAFDAKMKNIIAILKSANI